MKNKEIEELLNKMKKCYGVMEFYLAYNEVDLLLSCIEQLEADYKEANDSKTWWTNRYEAVVKQNDDKQKRINKAIEYNEHLIEHAKYHLNLGHLKKMRKILKGDSE